MSTSVKLGIAACIVAGVTAYMAYIGTKSSWQYYLTVDECLSDAEALVDQRIRVNGKIVAGSLEYATDREQATFKIQERDLELSVSCRGPLPDNLAEATEVVVEGRLDAAGCLNAEKVLTRCASKYAPAARSATNRPQAFAEGRRR